MSLPLLWSHFEHLSVSFWKVCSNNETGRHQMRDIPYALSRISATPHLPFTSCARAATPTLQHRQCIRIQSLALADRENSHSQSAFQTTQQSRQAVKFSNLIYRPSQQNNRLERKKGAVGMHAAIKIKRETSQTHPWRTENIPKLVTIDIWKQSTDLPTCAAPDQSTELPTCAAPELPVQCKYCIRSCVATMPLSNQPEARLQVLTKLTLRCTTYSPPAQPRQGHCISYAATRFQPPQPSMRSLK